MYATHSQIPALTAEYISTVAGVLSVEELSLEEINGFMAMLEQAADESYYMTQWA